MGAGEMCKAGSQLWHQPSRAAADQVEMYSLSETGQLLTSLATAMSPGCATQVPSCPSCTSRSLSTRTFSKAACGTQGKTMFTMEQQGRIRGELR